MNLKQHKLDLSKFVVHYPQFISSGLADKIIKETQSGLSWEKDLYGHVRSADTITLNTKAQSRLSKEYQSELALVKWQLQNRLQSYLRKTKQKIGLNLVPRDFELLRYSKGTECKMHLDLHSNGSSSNQIMLFSAIISLNDDYAGGRLFFWNTKNNFRLPKGDLVIFPAGSLFPHGVSKITSGSRFSLVTWFDPKL